MEWLNEFQCNFRMFFFQILWGCRLNRIEKRYYNIYDLKWHGNVSKFPKFYVIRRIAEIIKYRLGKLRIETQFYFQIKHFLFVKYPHSNHEHY